MADVFIKEWEILLEENLEVGKILQGMRFEPVIFQIRSAVTDCSAILDTGSEDCCWVLMGKILGVGGCFLVFVDLAGLHVVDCLSGWVVEFIASFVLY